MSLAPHIVVEITHLLARLVLVLLHPFFFPLYPLMIALLPFSCPIRADVQNVRRMFYGLLRNHSPAQVTQCSATQERGRERRR